MHPADFNRDLGPAALVGCRVVLVNMPLREGAPPNCAPLGPALLAARLREFGADVSILDLNAYRVKDALAAAQGLPHGRHLTAGEADGLLARHLARHGEPHLVGLSGKITTLRWQRHVAKTVRAFLPNVLLVSGGGLATEFRAGLFRWIPELDGVAHSEGDDLIVKIARDAMAVHRYGRDGAALGGKLDPYLQGRHIHGATLSLLYAGDRPKDLDALPLPAWDLLETDVDGYPVLETYLRAPIWGLEAQNSSAAPFSMARSLNTVSSRGCPYACRFCFRGAQGERNYGVRSAAGLAAEMAWLKWRYRVDFVGVLDDNFMVRPDRIAAMVPELGPLTREGLRWGTHGRLDEAADLRPGGEVAARRRVDDMRAAGCAYIGFGAESASPKTLEAMGKGGFILANGTERIGGFDLPKTMLVGYANTIQADIHGNCTWIMGYPGEGLHELQHSAAFIAWQKDLVGKPAAVNSRMFTATAYPGTDLFKHPKVQARLAAGFGLAFGPDGQPVVDDALLSYVLELDDATKVLTDKRGEPVYYGEMTRPQFEQCRELADAGRVEEILAL